MIDLHGLLHVAPITQGSALLALQVIGEVRCELDQMRSLVEVGLDQADAADAIGSTKVPEWRRAVDIGRVLRDLTEVNSRHLGDVERKLLSESANLAAEEVTA